MTSATKHTYLRTHRLSGELVSFNLRDEEERQLVKAKSAKAGRAAKTIVKEGQLRVTTVALRKGAVLQEHEVEGDCTIQVSYGQLVLKTDDRSLDLRAGAVIAVRQGVTHSAVATTDCMFLLTVAMADGA